METVLPSEVARLVYGYLLEEDCHEAAAKFLETSPQLKECLFAFRNGKKFQTKFEGRNLVEILDVLPQVKTQAQIVAGELPQNSLLWNKELLELLYMLSVNVVPCMESDGENSENDNEQNQLPSIPESIIVQENLDVPIRLNNFKSSDLSDGSDSCPFVGKDILNQSGIADKKKEHYSQKKSRKDLVLSDIEEEDHEVIDKNNVLLDEINENDVTEYSKVLMINETNEEDASMVEKDDLKLVVIEEIIEDISVTKEEDSELAVIEEKNEEDVLINKEEDSKLVVIEEVDENEVGEKSKEDIADVEDTISNVGNDNEDEAQYYKPIAISSYIYRYRNKKRGKGGKKWKNDNRCTTVCSTSSTKQNDSNTKSNISSTKHNSSDSKSKCESHSYDSGKKNKNNLGSTHIFNSSAPKSKTYEAKSNSSSVKNKSSNPKSNSSNSGSLSSALKSNSSRTKSNFTEATDTSSDSKPNPLDNKYVSSDTKSKSSSGEAKPLAPKSSPAIAEALDPTFYSSALKFNPSDPHSYYLNFKPNFLPPNPNSLLPNPDCSFPKFNPPNLHRSNLNEAANIPSPLFDSMASLNVYRGPTLYKSPQAPPYNPHMINLQASHTGFSVPLQSAHVSGNIAVNKWMRDSNASLPPSSAPFFVNRHVMQTSSYGEYPPSSSSFVQGGVQVVMKKVVTQMIDGGHPGVSQSIITNHTVIRPNASLNQNHLPMSYEQLPRHR